MSIVDFNEALDSIAIEVFGGEGNGKLSNPPRVRNLERLAVDSTTSLRTSLEIIVENIQQYVVRTGFDRNR
jgi:hypothetical protein